MIHIREFTEQELMLLNRCLATLIKQVDDKDYLGIDPMAPHLDSNDLCRLRMKVAPHIGVTESIQKL